MEKEPKRDWQQFLTKYRKLSPPEQYRKWQQLSEEEREYVTNRLIGRHRFPPWLDFIFGDEEKPNYLRFLLFIVIPPLILMLLFSLPMYLTDY